MRIDWKFFGVVAALFVNLVLWRVGVTLNFLGPLSHIWGSDLWPIK
jgi:hypothetical protein